MGFASWLRYCSDVAQRRSTRLCTMFGRLHAGLVHCIYIFWGSCPVTEFCHVQNSLCVQLLHSPILAALLHVKTGKHENRIFSLPEFNQLRDFFNLSDSRLILTLLSDSLSVVAMHSTRGCWGHGSG